MKRPHTLRRGQHVATNGYGLSGHRKDLSPWEKIQSEMLLFRSKQRLVLVKAKTPFFPECHESLELSSKIGENSLSVFHRQSWMEIWKSVQKLSQIHWNMKLKQQSDQPQSWWLVEYVEGTSGRLLLICTYIHLDKRFTS